MKRIAWLSGAAYGFLGVALGAFGAHALRDHLTASGHADVYATATKYHLFHALLLLVMGLIAQNGPSKVLRAAIACVIAGTFVFSGSLYVLAAFDIPKMGMITPAGGVLLLAGWAFLFIHSYRKTKRT